ncbi:phosphoribosylamine--glycine ligase [Tenuifilum sp.]|uniref:phosphoribosylamine--glycine ligase n=1 Tax=Tenuifilum sp. TaxID=2760880 RepID=UPI002C5FED6C|nr:phosphoribosylamine--glycine ligase [Tenuifilum sp.]HOU74783.1 phosphoribosylamine--glycine ligase [Tenuifilum sp.]HQE54979.1 phosphoribosylamine--glycine ligase [Tenuifilum sp.]HQI89585.1 phosphoribosylamine--glycine ligase [Tenuifilum sp.]
MDKKLNVLLLGSGGREHALAWKISQSPLLEKLFIAPGNPGTGYHGQNVAINPLNFDEVKGFCVQSAIDMVIVGPEEPLVQGIHDSFLSDSNVKHIPVIGPQKLGAMLEGSKDFAKEFMFRHGIPTAQYKTFTAEKFNQAKDFLKTLNPPYVLKADGLAAGKGVVIVPSYDEACANLQEFFAGKFGAASQKVVIEEFLSGIELSVFVLTDGHSYIILPEAKDYKRIGDGDTGPNTGGMGAVSPVPFANQDFMKKVEERIVKPTINGLRNDAIPYKGFIFIGLMNVYGDPYVIEYNVRMGDPETEVVMPRIKSDLLAALLACSQNRLSEASIEVDSQTATTVIVVSGGYPNSYEKGKEIATPASIPSNAILFHAGTSISNGKLVTAGGRVFACSALGNGIDQALEKSYTLAKAIKFDKLYYRNDIGNDLKKLQNQ